jgi:hypothetical protein
LSYYIELLLIFIITLGNDSIFTIFSYPGEKKVEEKGIENR